jgi:hypothetical protein
LGLSRNKVAVPEGVAGTPPFWRYLLFSFYLIARRRRADWRCSDT